MQIKTPHVAPTSPPTNVPIAPEWVARRFSLSPAVAKLIADHAFAPCASWQGRRP